MSEHQPPLLLFMDNLNGEEVALTIEPTDDFHSFLSNAKALLGYEVDINTITNNQPISPNENIYKFLINSDKNLASQLPARKVDEMLDPNSDANDLVYILDDGTQIRASQIHFDNEDPHIDLSAEKLPFVKHTDDGAEDFDAENAGKLETIKFNIAKSPLSPWATKESLKYNFVDTLPFKLVCDSTVFEAQFDKYLESSAAKTYTTLNPVINRNKSPRTLIKDNYGNCDDKFKNGNECAGYTREDILNMFKDAPVTSLPDQNFEKRRHVRKTDPSRGVYKNWNAKPANLDEGILIADSENRNCLICGKFVDNNNDKLYIFDKEDQRLHRSSSPKKASSQLKIICERCLGDNFKPCRMKGLDQCLNSDEYLVIKNNQQYIFQKTNKIDFVSNKLDEVIDAEPVNGDEDAKHQDKIEFVKVEIGSDGEIVTKAIDHEPGSFDDIVLPKDEDKNGSSSDVEILDATEMDDAIDNLEDADEEVKEFLGKYQADCNSETVLKCRFCERVFADISEVISHGDEHKHDTEDGAVFPCSLCDYGYTNAKWLKAHIKAAHEKPEPLEDENDEKDIVFTDKDKPSTNTSPIAKRTRSCKKKVDDGGKVSPVKTSGDTAQIITNSTTEDSTITIKTEVKQEPLESSDDEIWIVQTGDDEATVQIESLLQAAKNGCKTENLKDSNESQKCDSCSRKFVSMDGLASHKCPPLRGRKRKSTSKEDNTIYVPTQEDFIKRAQGRPKNSCAGQSNDLSIVKPRRKKNKEPSSDPQIVTCHNCNESFTSKVRLKFHMQFHSPSRATNGSSYKCLECSARFSSEAELFDHAHFQHDARRRWQCPVAGCGKTFRLRATLTKHSRTHTDTRRYVCVTCGKRFLDKQTLDEHGVTHLQIKPFQCHICLKQLTRRSRLRMHLRAHEEELTLKLVLVCAICNRAFRDHADAQDHATKSAECIEEFTKELKEDTEDNEAQLSPTSGLVRQPVKIDRGPPKLDARIPRQVSQSLAEPLLSALGDEARNIIRVVEIEKAFRCEYCEDVFYLEDGLNIHRAIHKGVKNPFTCHICKVSFATYSRCTTHKTTHGFYKRSLDDVKKNATRPKETESGPSATGILGYGGFPVVKHFLCEDCGRSYLHWTYLQVHRRMKHANDNMLHKCQQCDITFPNSWGLAYHKKKVHSVPGDTNAISKESGENHRIPCRDCEEVLPNKTALYKHRKNQHSDMTRVNNTSWCVPCSKQFHSSVERDAKCAVSVAPAGSIASCTKCGVEHTDAECRRTHACPVCSRVFRSVSVRDEHLRTHTGERPYPCDICGLAFRRSTAMRNHRLIHTGVRAWACERCPKRFRIRSDLRTHAKLKHPVHLAVIEIEGLNPSVDEVLSHLAANNISHDNVIEITKMSFTKGSVSIIPTCARALSMLGDVPRSQVVYSKPAVDHDNMDYETAPRRGRGLAKNPRRLTTHEESENTPQDCNPYPITINVTGGELTDTDVQLLLREGVLVNGNQMVELQLENNSCWNDDAEQTTELLQ